MAVIEIPNFGELLAPFMLIVACNASVEAGVMTTAPEPGALVMLEGNPCPTRDTDRDQPRFFDSFDQSCGMSSSSFSGTGFTVSAITSNPSFKLSRAIAAIAR